MNFKKINAALGLLSIVAMLLHIGYTVFAYLAFLLQSDAQAADGYTLHAAGVPACRLQHADGIYPGGRNAPRSVSEAEPAHDSSASLRCADPAAVDPAHQYFMEETYGAGGNLMTRDIVSREIGARGGKAWLDISFLDKSVIDQRLPEVRDLCAKYASLDVIRQPISVQPSVHFFMGGLSVHLNHETNIRGLFAVGECASMYHGANRLGGNSQLAAIYSGSVAASTIADRSVQTSAHPDFSEELEQEKKKLDLKAFTIFVMCVKQTDLDQIASGEARHSSVLRKSAVCACQPRCFSFTMPLYHNPVHNKSACRPATNSPYKRSTRMRFLQG